jgi:hydroxymethylpyrimidine pyrophosphatase-like HAD family hydrolase
VARHPPRFPRALFFDLDGTLLAPGAILRHSTAEAVWAAAERGALIVLATGGFSQRTHLIQQALGTRAPGAVWAITHNGAAVWAPDGRPVRLLATPREAVEAVLGVAGRRVWATFETAGADGHTAVYYAGRMRPELVPLLWGPQAPTDDVPEEGLRVGLEPRWDWRRARSPRLLASGAILGCWCVGTPAALAPLDANAVGGVLLGARYLPWGLRLGQITGMRRLRIVGRDVGPREASKGAAAAWLCEHLGIDPAATAAFGDGDNDLELLQFAGLAVGMANGTPAARACADLIAPPNDEDGVGQVLRQWLDAL